MLLNNRYRVIQTLGSGGFGETFLAEDTQIPSKRRCVIKQLKPINNNPNIYNLAQERFQREAVTLEELGDGNNQIPRLYAYFSENGQFYLVQEYIQGQTLSSIVQSKGVMSENEVKGLLVNILPVLDFVHTKGIIHRDIKPDNILIRSCDQKPILIDFGAVKEILGTTVALSKNSTRSIVIGTPGFMPSEQSVGRPMYISDIYSLGMTAIYLLTGVLPHEIPSDPTTGAVLWRQYALNVTVGFAALLDKATQFNPENRFTCAKEMFAALQSPASAFISTVVHTQASIYKPLEKTLVPTRLENTIAVTPTYQQLDNSPETSPQAHKTKAQGIIIFGLLSLIGACFIGGAIIIASAINRPLQQIINQQPKENKPVTIAPSPQPFVTPDNKPSPKDSKFVDLAQPQPTSNPFPPLKTPPQSSPQPLPFPKPVPTVTIAITKLEKQEPQSKIVPTAPKTSGSQPSSPKVPALNQPSPEQFVRDYYFAINDTDFKGAWNKLSPTYQNNKNLHPKGFESYLDWWSDRVQQVDIQEVKLVEVNKNIATVDARLNYLLKDSNKISTSLRLILIWDTVSKHWLVNDAHSI